MVVIISLCSHACTQALAAVRSGTRGHHDKVDVTETRRFAGKDIQVRSWFACVSMSMRVRVLTLLLI